MTIKQIMMIDQRRQKSIVFISLFHNFKKKEKEKKMMCDDDDDEPPARKVMDTSVKDDYGRCPVFCARCMIIRNIRLAHSEECIHSQQYKSTREECNEAPLALCVCHCCLPFGRHMVPIADQPAEENSPVDYQLTMEAEAEVQPQPYQPEMYSNIHNGAGFLPNLRPYSLLMTQAHLEQAQYLASLGPYSRLMAEGNTEERSGEATWDQEMGRRTDSNEQE